VQHHPITNTDPAEIPFHTKNSLNGTQKLNLVLKNFATEVFCEKNEDIATYLKIYCFKLLLGVARTTTETDNN